MSAVGCDGLAERCAHEGGREEGARHGLVDDCAYAEMRRAARGELFDAAGELGIDELRVLARIGRRLAIGALQYGALDVASDERDFDGKEAREEIEDGLVYFACAWLKREAMRGGAQ